MTFGTHEALLAMAVLVAFFVGLLCAVVAGVLAKADGATIPEAVTRAGVAFAAAMGVATGLLTLFGE
ncbi:hypothetical protein K7B10_23950 [Streptomyces flavotricini]|uniref:Uncharacterized protein n=1 Tax=Streptomyces flavotricini TaxID=66888 RepID=A0ABS8E9F5_9ACTN|nr:hypothetical protein [Streptomyces flavotricini]MCC0097775.1 hypothetical protein [Streptomyces flavotricini]